MAIYLTLSRRLNRLVRATGFRKIPHSALRIKKGPVLATSDLDESTDSLNRDMQAGDPVAANSTIATIDSMSQRRHCRTHCRMQSQSDWMN
jgi:hypothetical protein